MAKTSGQLIARAPVVVIMGHVDHGKTTLLDYIRNTRVASKEAGGITQHLGAYEVQVNSRAITFLDTPGHEAFNKIRERGSAVADVAILVVAAEEGLKPQTVEALSYIQKLNLPYIIALNKMDRPGANADKVKQQFAEKGVYVEGWGGSVPVVEISAKTGQNIDTLLELILLVSDMNPKQSNPQADPEGVVLESSRDAKRGLAANVLVLNGTLHRGDAIYTQSGKAKVKILENFLGKTVSELSFSSPASVIGWETQPLVGEWFSTDESVYQSEHERKENVSPEADTREHVLKLILKADVSGSLEALETVISYAIKQTQTEFTVVDKSIGDITLSDLKTAEAANALIVAFRSDMSQETKGYVQSRPITIIKGDIIYHLAEELQQMLAKRFTDINVPPSAQGEIIAIFSQPDNKKRMVVGVRLTDGTVSQNDSFSIVRDETEIGTGKAFSLKKNKDELEQIEATGEYGIQIQTETAVALHDVLRFHAKT